MALCQTCLELNVPLVHGAIAGWYGQVTTQYPGDEHPTEDLRAAARVAKVLRRELGNPSFTPAVVASLEVAEVCKILLGKGRVPAQPGTHHQSAGYELQEIAFSKLPTFPRVHFQRD